jgi:hypothetical protein
MSSTYTGIVLTGTPTFTSQPAQAFPDYDDIQGTLVELDSLPSGVTVDDIFYYNSPTSGKYLQRVIDGAYRAVWAGIVGGGANQATKLQTLVSDNRITEILFDDPRGAVITLNSAIITVDPNKILRFAEGNMFTGNATINGGIIDASFSSQIATTSITLNPQGTTTGKFSVKWYGAKGDHATNDYAAIQKCIDIIIANKYGASNERMVHTLFFPSGYYICNSPLVAANWNGTIYDQFTMFFEGETSFWESSASGSALDFTGGNEQNFGLAIQGGKGVQIKGLKFFGGFQPPNNAVDYDFFSQSFAAFTDRVSRDQIYSPYAGIVIDPFAHTYPPGGSSAGYPGFNGQGTSPQYYRGTSGTGTSTGTIITDVYVTNFVVGICNSPNGVLNANAELMLIEKTQFYGCKVCVSSSHEQEKTNVLRHCACWGGTHTFFATHRYGVQTPGNWIIDSVQLAGNVINFIYNPATSAYFPIFISNIFAESCARFGVMSSNTGSQVQNVTFDFARPDTETSAYMDWLIEGSGVTYKNCNFRIYNNAGWSVSIKGASLSEDCTFDVIPYTGLYGQYVNNEGGPRFIDCRAGGNVFGASTPVYYAKNRTGYSIYGDTFVVDPSPNYPNVKQGLVLKNSTLFKEIFIGSHTVDVDNLGTNRSFSITGIPIGWYDANDIGKLVVSDHLGGSSLTPAGIITAVTSSTSTTVTVSYASSSLIDGTWNFCCVYPLLFTASFMGEVTASSPDITNVQLDWGNLSGTVGNLLRTPSFAEGTYNNWIKVKSLSGSTLTMCVNSYYSDSAVYFSNAESKFAESDSTNFGLSTFQYEAFPRGARIKQFHFTRQIEFEVTKSGYINGSPRQPTG